MLTLSPGPIWMIFGGESEGVGAGLLEPEDCAEHTAKQQTDQISTHSPDLTVTEQLDTPKPPKNLNISPLPNRESYITISVKRENIDSPGQSSEVLR
jgi:hypothetical protein